MKFYFDFEANQFTEHIISVGCVSETGEKFYSLVGKGASQKAEKITKFITDLTGITQTDYDSAPSADYVFLSLYEWIHAQVMTGNSLAEYYCYGDCDTKFLDKTLECMENFPAITFLLSLRAAIVNYAPIIAHSVGKSAIGLQRVYNFLKNEETKQNHSALKDAEMLKFVMDNIDKLNPDEDIPEAPGSKPTYYSGAVTKFPTGRFFCKGLGQNAKERSFIDIHAAMDWLINTHITKDKRDEVHKERMALKILKAIQKKGTYMNYRWRREK